MTVSFAMQKGHYHYVMSFFVSFDLCCFKDYFIRDENCNSCFFLLSICLVNLPPSLYFEPLCILACEMGFPGTAHRWVWLFIQYASLCLLIGAFSPFTFRANIVMCVFDPAILLMMKYFCFLVFLLTV